MVQCCLQMEGGEEGGGETDGLKLSLTEYCSAWVPCTLLLFTAILVQSQCGNDLIAKLLWIK